jgi:hypothetical protein
MTRSRMKKQARKRAAEKARPLPTFRNEAEEAEFWATHDSADYWDEFQDVDEPLELDPELAQAIDRRSRRKTLVSLRLEAWQVRLARAVAARRRLPYHAVLRGWIEQGIRSRGAGVSS